MLKLQYKNFNSSNVGSALRKLYTFTGYSDPKVTYRVGRIVQKVQESMNHMRDGWTKLVQEYTLLDDKKEPILDNFGNFNFKSKEHEEAYNKAHAELQNTEVEIKVWPIPLAELGRAALSPDELTAISWMISDLPDEAEEPETNVIPMKKG